MTSSSSSHPVALTVGPGPVESNNNNDWQEGVQEEDEDSEDSCNNNPMLIDLVLDKVFEACGFKDLTRCCRLVSKQWYRVSLPHWLKKAPRWSFELVPEDGSMAAFLRLVHQESHSYEPYELAGLRQYQNFGLWADLGVDDVQYCLLEQFMHKAGGSIRDLKFNINFTDLDTYRMVVLSEMTPKLVKMDALIRFAKEVDVKNGIDDIVPPGDHQGNLTTLAIKFGCFDTRLPATGWLQILQRYPSLKTILLGVEFAESCRDVYRMLEAVGNIRQVNPKMLDLKRLEMVCKENDHDYFMKTSPLAHFRKARLTLETLNIAFGRLTSASVVHDVLASQASTLKKLIIHKRFDAVGGGGGAAANATPLFPNLDSVETLEVHGLALDDLTFLRNFKSLKTLRVAEDQSAPFSKVLDATKKEQLDGLLVVVPNLTKLQIDQGFRPTARVFNPSSEGFQKLRRVMPNVTHVDMCLNNESFREVCRCWPQLEHLLIIGNQVDDEGLNNAGIIGNVEHDITHLKALKSLKMMHTELPYDIGAAPIGITRNSVPALLELPNLERLEVTVKRRLDEDAFAALRGKIDSVKITVASRRLMCSKDAPSDYDDDDDEEEDYPTGNSSNPGVTVDDDDDSDGGGGGDNNEGGGNGDGDADDGEKNDVNVDDVSSCCGCVLS